jgi:hypothetical protein
MEVILIVCAIFGIAFFLKESDGPFDIMSKLRHYLISNKYVGVFFYNLLSCYFCVGCHTGYLVYLLITPMNLWTINWFIIWVFAGGTISYLINSILERNND